MVVKELIKRITCGRVIHCHTVDQKNGVIIISMEVEDVYRRMKTNSNYSLEIFEGPFRKMA